MKIVYDKPKFWWLVRLLHPNVEWGDIAMSFGDTIYTAKTMPAHVLVHEKTHIRQMRESKLLGVLFSLGYGVSKRLRLRWELEAYIEQYRYIRDSVSDKNAVEKARKVLAKELAGPIYKNMITYERALQLII